MHPSFKKTLIVTLIGGGLLMMSKTLAQINVKSDLSNAIQNIQNIFFSPEGIKNPDPSKNILVHLKDGVLHISGNVLMETDTNQNILAPEAKGSSLIQGSGNKLAGKYSFILAGNSNEVHTGATNAIVGGGRTNIIESGTKNGVILGGKMNRIKNGSHSTILGGRENSIEGNNSFIAGGNQISIKGDNSFAAGTYIKADTPVNNVFVWSDSFDKYNLKQNGGGTYFKPTQDNTFLIRAHNGVGIGTSNPKVKGIDVNGMVQIASEDVTCAPQTTGALQYTNGCFCGCNGHIWENLTPSENCSNICGKLKKKAIIIPECVGPIPKNATLVPGDDKGIIEDSRRKLVAKNTPAKCEYVCNKGYVFYDATQNAMNKNEHTKSGCVKIYSGTWECKSETNPGSCKSQNGEDHLKIDWNGAPFNWGFGIKYDDGHNVFQHPICKNNISTRGTIHFINKNNLWSKRDRSCQNLVIKWGEIIGSRDSGFKQCARKAKSDCNNGCERIPGTATKTAVCSTGNPADCDPKNKPTCNSPINYTCTGPTPANARLIPGDDKELTANTPKKVVDRNTSAKCEYTCYSGYENKNGSCVKKLEPKCGAKAYTCEIGESRSALLCSAGASCWECQKGSSSVSCKINPTYSCTGKDPSNATLVPGDNKGLTKNTEKKLVSKNTSAKCEYTCNEGYRFTNILGSHYCRSFDAFPPPAIGCPEGQKLQYYENQGGIGSYRCVPDLPDFPSECKENPACGKVEHGVTGPCYCTKKYSDETNIDNDISRHREGGRGLDPDSNGGPHNTTSTLRP